jgi:hypothetical protein
MSAPAPPALVPDAIGWPPACQALRAACDPRDTSPPSGAQPLGMLLEHAITARLTCLLADWLDRGGHAARLARPVQQFLRDQLRLNVHRWGLHHREAARVIAALQAEDIPAAAINGIACASLLYDGRGTRQSSDVDILIPASVEGTATQVLAGLGYTPAGRPATFRRDLADPVVPDLYVDLTSRLAHAGDPAAVTAALGRRVLAPSHAHAPEPLPVLARDDGFLHALVRVSSRRRWPGLADALRYALDAGVRPAAPDAIPPAAATGWDLVRRCWPELPAQPPLASVEPR